MYFRAWIAAVAVFLTLSSPCPCRSSDASYGLLLIKSRHLLVLFKNNRGGITVLKTYPVSLGRRPGMKTMAGDHRTPEGDYTIDGRQAGGKFHMALDISYPNSQDRSRARNLGVPPGKMVRIHGFPDGTTPAELGEYRDWTKGCIALANGDLEEIWGIVPNGTPLKIVP